MSRRCSICDFSTDLPSIYHEGLVTSDLPVKNNLKYRKKEGDYICIDCHYETKWDLPEDIDPLGTNNE